ncbi:hypothetical protein JX266_007760 [Neoarthrinium moseri]|uniref:uncharacterized protein n=1 Tax=Neoarthrinium moseri TaxID=1658444 RepID=UPI001FDD5DDE|nr:uncharacterized protein JN550_011148 [Neoarthrinium moseri]KAI1846235.1 hypothetical protein JX266_007760 [Neoarthrinium moseri]KAI1860993.1 hypothetical protein JN550_011148 [Neoarthrinium moseri]
MAQPQVDATWMWHPNFTEERTDTAGLFVHFRNQLIVDSSPPPSLVIGITADTRYKLYVNGQLASFGPVKGDPSLWFVDEVDVGPYLRTGTNEILVIVLRFFYASPYATSFPRLPLGGLRVTIADAQSSWHDSLKSSTHWSTAIDETSILRIDEPEDDFLHIYEYVDKSQRRLLEWVPAKVHEFMTSTGNATPWHLSPRIIPPMKREAAYASAVHHVQSNQSLLNWESVLLRAPGSQNSGQSLTLSPHSSHHFDVEMAQHTTAFVRLRFKRPRTAGSVLNVTYSESYEDEPTLVPYLRRKGHRCDYSKSLYGPQDRYHFGGITAAESAEDQSEESFMPFHFRTFRFLRMSIDVGDSELDLEGIEIEAVNYPLEVLASFKATPSGNGVIEQLWSTSVRTLSNCMHDCYEDCPFYEQLQYAMDTRSSCLFTYYVSGDDRLARQAITQIHNSFQSRLGLTCSRAPSHKPQFIPHFSLFWILMLDDYMKFYGDKSFLEPLLPAVDAILGYFHRLIDQKLGLVASNSQPGIWNFVDWAEAWRPYGIPPAAERTGFSTYTNNLYAYTLKHAATLVTSLGRPGIAGEYLGRASNIIDAVRNHCFDGELFSDGLASSAIADIDYSEQNQVWSVLSGAASASVAATILRKSLEPAPAKQLVRSSVSMSFYTLRALSAVGGNIYDETFHQFWDPWRQQLALGLTTWEEDSVSQRSDCHAWGSAPIYEFMAEVAGVRPASPGWESIEFSPRLNLFSTIEATVPLRQVGAKSEGLVHVSWVTNAEGVIKITLRLELQEPKLIPIHVKLPSQPLRVVDSASDYTFVVQSGTLLEGTP